MPALFDWNVIIAQHRIFWARPPVSLKRIKIDSVKPCGHRKMLETKSDYEAVGTARKRRGSLEMISKHFKEEGII